MPATHQHIVQMNSSCSTKRHFIESSSSHYLRAELLTRTAGEVWLKDVFGDIHHRFITAE